MIRLRLREAEQHTQGHTAFEARLLNYVSNCFPITLNFAQHLVLLYKMHLSHTSHCFLQNTIHKRQIPVTRWWAGCRQGLKSGSSGPVEKLNGHQVPSGGGFSALEKRLWEVKHSGWQDSGLLRHLGEPWPPPGQNPHHAAVGNQPRQPPPRPDQRLSTRASHCQGQACLEKAHSVS